MDIVCIECATAIKNIERTGGKVIKWTHWHQHKKPVSSFCTSYHCD